MTHLSTIAGFLALCRDRGYQHEAETTTSYRAVSGGHEVGRYCLITKIGWLV